MFALQRWFLYPRHATLQRPAAARRADLEQLWVRSPDGPVEGWLLPGHGVSAAHPGPAVIFAHGNAELIDDWVDELQPYRALGVSVLLPEYRGYGRSAGAPAQEAITADLVAFYDLLAARPEVDRERILFHGRSLGGGAVCALAEQRAPRALILQSTFTSIGDLAGRYLLPRFLVCDPFENLATVARFAGPVLLFHGRQDELIPFAHAERLRGAAKQGRLVAYDAGHNDCPPRWDALWREIEVFLRGAGLLAQHEGDERP